MTTSSKAATRRRESRQTAEESRSVDPFEDLDFDDPSAVRQALTRLAAEEAANRPPPPKDRAEAKRAHDERQRAYKARMLARGLDLDDMPGILAKQQARYDAFIASQRAANQT